MPGLFFLTGQKALENYVAPLLKSCDNHIQNILFAKPPHHLTAESEEKLFR